MKSEELGIISDRVFKYGVAIAIGLIIIGGLFETTRYFRKKISSHPAAIVKESVNSPLICHDAIEVNLSPKMSEKTIMVRSSCLYSKINPQRLGSYELKIDLPKDKAVKYYVIKGDNIIGPLDSPAGNNNEFDFGINPYAIMGYDGIATLRLIHS